MKRVAKYTKFDKKTQTTTLHDVTKSTSLTTNNMNVSKNRYNVHDDRKSYLSHVESVQDVHELFSAVENMTDKTVRETQYFVFISVNKKDDIRLRIQKNAIEIHSDLLATDDNAKLTVAVKDAVKYSHFVECKTLEEVEEIVKRF